MSLVYLAGPITGLSYEGCTDWRDGAVEELAAHGLIGLSPMRGKDYLLGEKCVGDSYENDPGKWMSTAKAVAARDRFDCQRVDMVILNLLGAERVSIGSMIEVGWADAARVPIVLVMEDGNCMDHTMMTHLCGWQVDSLEKAIDTVVAILGDPRA